MRSYYAEMKPQLCMSKPARELVHLFLSPPLTRETATIWPATHAVRIASIALIPRWMRQLGGFDQTGVIDAASLPLTRATITAFANRRLQRAGRHLVSPHANAIFEQAQYGESPIHQHTVTPSQARESAQRGRAAGTRRRSVAA